jgi:hypothetical protein
MKNRRRDRSLFRPITYIQIGHKAVGTLFDSAAITVLSGSSFKPSTHPSRITGLIPNPGLLYLVVPDFTGLSLSCATRFRPSNETVRVIQGCTPNLDFTASCRRKTESNSGGCLSPVPPGTVSDYRGVKKAIKHLKPASQAQAFPQVGKQCSHLTTYEYPLPGHL